MNNDVMETAVEYMWVDICCMLDWIIGLCHKTAEMHFPGMSRSTSEYTKCDAAVVADHYATHRCCPQNYYYLIYICMH